MWILCESLRGHGEGNGYLRPMVNPDKDPRERALMAMVPSLTQPLIRPALKWVYLCKLCERWRIWYTDPGLLAWEIEHGALPQSPRDVMMKDGGKRVPLPQSGLSSSQRLLSRRTTMHVGTYDMNVYVNV
jgi:hypothetical protein